jgi:hypothetical protein
MASAGRLGANRTVKGRLFKKLKFLSKSSILGIWNDIYVR